MTELSSPTRSGRAGRVRPGECWSLVTRKTAENMAPFPTPEIERVSIDQLYLRIESSLDGFTGTNIVPSTKGLLQRFLDPPSSTAIDDAVQRLVEIGAISEIEQELTPLGQHLSFVPIEIRLAKILLFGNRRHCPPAVRPQPVSSPQTALSFCVHRLSLFFQCLSLFFQCLSLFIHCLSLRWTGVIFGCVDPITTIVACLGGGRSVMTAPAGMKDKAAEAHAVFAVKGSDLLTLLKVYEAWADIRDVRSRRDFCREYFLSDSALLAIATLRNQLLTCLVTPDPAASCLHTERWGGERSGTRRKKAERALTTTVCVSWVWLFLNRQVELKFLGAGNPAQREAVGHPGLQLNIPPWLFCMRWCPDSEFRGK